MSEPDCNNSAPLLPFLFLSRHHRCYAKHLQADSYFHHSDADRVRGLCYSTAMPHRFGQDRPRRLQYFHSSPKVSNGFRHTLSIPAVEPFNITRGLHEAFLFDLRYCPDSNMRLQVHNDHYHIPVASVPNSFDDNHLLRPIFLDHNIPHQFLCRGLPVQNGLHQTITSGFLEPVITILEPNPVFRDPNRLNQFCYKSERAQCDLHRSVSSPTKANSQNASELREVFPNFHSTILYCIHRRQFQAQFL